MRSHVTTQQLAILHSQSSCTNSPTLDTGIVSVLNTSKTEDTF